MLCGDYEPGLARERSWFRKQRKVGNMMQTNRRTWQSFDEMRLAAEQGDPAAQCYFGICHQTGQGVQQDYGEAVKWFRRAAEQNDSAAQCYLGFCYQTGSGVPQDVQEAVRWFCRAARQGDKTAQHNLGVYYTTLEAAEEATAEGETEAGNEPVSQ